MPGTTVGGWRAQQLHEVALTSFGLSDKFYGLNPIALRPAKKARPQRCSNADGNRYAYLLTDKGHKGRLLFVLFPQRLYGRSPNVSFTTVPTPNSSPTAHSKRPCQSRRLIRKVIQLLDAT